MFTNDGVKSVNYFEFESYKKGGVSLIITFVYCTDGEVMSIKNDYCYSK